MKLRHVLPLIATAAALGIAGCGDDEPSASSALDEALGYLPPDAGFAFIASTDTADYEEIDDILGKFPFGGQAKSMLEDALEQEGVDFERDVKPLLGNPVVVGTPDNESFVAPEGDNPFVMALETADAGKLEELASQDTEDRGEAEGHDLYETSDGTWLAVKDDVAVLSNDEDTLKQALERRGQEDRLGEDDIEATFEDLPEDAPVRVYANVAALLAADPDTQDALKIKWIDHIETLGLAADAAEDRISLEYAVKTNPDGLTDDDLPLASGSETPQVFEREDGSAEIVLGLREPIQLIEFAQAAGKAVDPGGFGQFEAAKQQFGKRLGIDVDEDVIGQLTGDITVVASLSKDFGIRAALEDAEAFEATLAKLMDGLPEFADGVTVTKPGKGEQLYGVATEDGQTYAIGVAEGALVIANDAGLAGEVATRTLVDPERASGAFVLEADAEQIANQVLSELGGLGGIGGRLFTGPLGSLTSSSEATTEGISGSLELEIE